MPYFVVQSRDFFLVLDGPVPFDRYHSVQPLVNNETDAVNISFLHGLKKRLFCGGFPPEKIFGGHIQW